MDSYPLPARNTRIGFHYYPDTLHYRESDLQAWLPELRSLGASWLVLTAPSDRAIPEPFIRSLVSAGIEPVLHFTFKLSELPDAAGLRTLFEAYARWGVHYAILFDRPNMRASWSTAAWMQEEPVERFLDRFLPYAEHALKAGLTPVFPPLEPGGNYWDTAFLRTALLSLQRRQKTDLLNGMALAAYAWNGERSLNWGAGGPERWPGARPYFTPSTDEDQRGFRIFDWYKAVTESVLQQPLPVLLLGVGSAWDHTTTAAVNPVTHAQTNLTIARLIAGETVNDPVKTETALEPVGEEVLCCNFWLLASSPASPTAAAAWFQPEGQTLPVVGAVRQWVASHEVENAAKESKSVETTSTVGKINHYLLLPVYEWGIAEWHLDVIRPFVRKYQPTVGFSPAEAAMAQRVTIIGNEQTFSEELLNNMRRLGCQVERISGNGTTIATLLAER